MQTRSLFSTVKILGFASLVSLAPACSSDDTGGEAAGEGGDSAQGGDGSGGSTAVGGGTSSGGSGPASGGASTGGGSEDCGGKGDAYKAGLSTTGDTFTVTLASAEPAPPALNNNRWAIEITDDAGNAVEGADLFVEPKMPAHGHGTPVDVLVEDMGGGTYVLDPVNLFMEGLWVVTIDVTTADASDSVTFSFCVL